MSEQTNPVSSTPQNEENVDIKALIFEYLIHWRVILLCLIAVLALTYVWLRYQSPVYNVNTTVLIKQEDNNKSAGNAANAMMAIQDIGMLSMANNFDNEVEIITSRTLVKKVVNALKLNIRYSESQFFSYPIDHYGTSPVQVYMTPEEADRLTDPVEMELTLTPDGKVSVEGTFVVDEEEQKASQEFNALPALFITPVGAISLTANSDTLLAHIDETRTIEATIISPSAAARACRENLSGTPTSKTTTIVSLNYKDGNIQRGTDFLNTLVGLYNDDANDDKNEVASKTAEFIDERIAIINSELGTTEGELASYKQRAGLTDLSTDAKLALEGSSSYQEKQAENTTQIRLIESLKSYINDPANRNEVLPSNIGLADQGLSGLIEQYNQMLIERKRLLRISSETNPAVVNLDVSIEAMRNNVITSVNSVERGLHITQANLDREARKYENRISDAPQQERELLSITRQQEIKANLYLLLLQKREENAITLAATANNGRIIEEPQAGINPIAPRKMLILLAAFVIGVALPVGILYLINLLRFKIESRADVEKITTVPVVGDIPQTEQKDGNPIVLHENRNDLMEEVFRSVRTNLQYMMRPGQKVILFTSTTPGEGKSFTAGNIAASFAFMGKKVVVVGLDIRKPGLNKVFRLSHKEDGITRYLADPEHTDLFSLCQSTDVSSNLFVLPGGAVPPNPTELVARPSLDQAIALLKERFDYVILDTAPIGIVTDTQLIARVADISVYVCRADYTHKSDYAFINDLQQSGKLSGLCTLINGINMNKRRNGYYYGYGKYGSYGRYGYGKKYGYGYGYGYGKK